MAPLNVPVIPSHRLETPYRRIATPLPTADGMALLETAHIYESLPMQGQPPIVWDRAEGFNVYDAAGNKWIDFTSGVLVTNAGHGRKEIVDAIVEQAQRPLLHTFGFANEPRIRLSKRLVELTPERLDKVFLFTTGSETTECAIKLMRTHGRRIRPDKSVIVSFEQSFHGRTLGAQMIGGITEAKQWIGRVDPGMVQVPFPDGFRWADISFDGFLLALSKAGIEPRNVAGVISESYQGGSAGFAPPAYFQALRKWCNEHEAILTFDEVQAGFGRSGKMFSFEHYDVVPDLLCLGKGLSGSLPVSALVGRADLMDQYPPLSMTNTHGGNPVCAAAALANIDLITNEKLVENAETVGQVLHGELWQQLKPFDRRIGAIQGKGLVAGVHLVKDEDNAPDPDLAQEITRHAIGRGLMLFAPVGLQMATIKISPPLCITREAVTDGVRALADAFADCLSG